MGAQTLLIPYVQSPEEAKAAVQAMHYPPKGIRSVAGITRASRFGEIDGYLANAEDELCLIVQVETAHALGQLEEIAMVDGMDGVFIGPADPRSSMGYPGQLEQPDVIKSIEVAIIRLKAIGVPSSILRLNEDFVRRRMELGTSFMAIGLDLGIMAFGETLLRTAAIVAKLKEHSLFCMILYLLFNYSSLLDFLG